MSDDSVDFELDLQGNTAAVAKKMATELARLESQLLKVNAATKATERGFARTRAFSPDQFRNIQNHANALERQKKSLRSLAPVSAVASKALRTFGISGGWIRKFSVDTAKAEVALRRLYRVKGGGVKGAGAVVGSIARRGVANYGGTVAKGAGSMALGAAGMAGSASLAVGGAAAAGAGLLGYSMASTAIQAEKVRFALDRITDGKGDEWWKTSGEYARKFGLNVNDVADALMGMKAGGFGDDLAKTMFQQFADMRSQGVDSNGINMALLGLKQLKAAGRATAEDLNQVTENLRLNKGTIWEQLGLELNKTAVEAKKLNENGKVTSDQMIKAISQTIAIQTKSSSPGEAGAMSVNNTVAGSWDKMTATFSAVSADALGSDALAPLRTSIQNFTAWIDGPGGKAAIGGFGGMMARLFEKAPAMIEGVIWFLDTALPKAWQTFTSSFSESGGTAALERLSGTAESLGNDNGAAFIGFMERGADAAGSMAGAIVSIADALSGLMPLLETASSAMFIVPKTVGWVSGLFSDGAATATANDNGSSIGGALGSGMASGMFGSTPMVQYAASQLTAAAESAARAQSETHSPSRAWERFGGDEGAGYSKGLLKAIPTIQSSASQMTGSAMGAANQNGGNGGGMGSVQVNISIERGQTDGKSDRDVMEIAADVFERRITQVFGRVAYGGVR